MREATEGKSFDAILEDEFRGIKEEWQSLYLIVCCFYQHGIYVRDTLIADLMGMTLVDLYDKSKDATDGVVIYDYIDMTKGLFAARARHRTIATVVWERCSTPSETEEILQRVLSSLNLNYAADASAFEHFVRSDRLVDSIQTLDGRIRFFDKACQKDPNSPYVRQHYARMLRRDSIFELAIGQIEEAINMNSNLRVLYQHTWSYIVSNGSRY